MPLDESKLVDVATKSIEFRQTIVTVLLGVVGFILGKGWPGPTGQVDRKVFKRLAPSLLLASGALVMMLLEQRRLVEAVSRDAFPAFSTQWLNFGEPILDTLLVLAALALLLGAW